MTTFNFGGTELSTFGKVTSWDGLYDIPDRRGEDMIIPYRHGRAHAGKYYDSRSIIIGLTIIGTSTTDLENKIDTLKTLISLRTQRTLTVTYTNGAIRTVQASVDRVMQTVTASPLIMRASIEFTCTSAYLRSNTAIADTTTTINTSPKAMTVDNTGTVEEREAKITLTGPLDNPTITNVTSGVTMTYGGTIATAETVVIQTNSWGEYTAYYGVANVIGLVTHSGAASLMVFLPGVNTLSITDGEATTGTVRVEFFPPYL